MARRRTSPVASARSPGDSGENILSLAVADSAHGHDHLHTDASLSSSMQRSLLRCRSSPPSSNRLKVAIILFALAAAIALGIPSRLIKQDAATQNHDGFLRASQEQQQQQQQQRDDEESEKELLAALYEFPLPASQAELDGLNEELSDLDPKFILQWAHRRLHLASPQQQQQQQHNAEAASQQHYYPLVDVTSFGPTGLVILHLLSQLHFLKDVPVITMDTLHLFPESYDFYETIRSSYDGEGMELLVTKPLRVDHPPGTNGEGVPAGVIKSRKDFEAAYGSAALWKDDPKRFTRLTKIDPLNKALDEWQAQMWITGRRRSSGGERSNMNVLEFAYLADDNEDGNGGSNNPPFDTRKGRWKLNPLAYWTYDQVWDYILQYKLPHNALYDKGYTSLGDEMTTRLPQKMDAAKAGSARDAYERSGRFVGIAGNQTECGLHSHRERVKEEKQQALESGEELEVPKLQCDKCIELNNENFEEKIASGEKGKEELLVEFYSPYCGGCQEFAPTLNELADHLSQLDVPSIQVARFDITEHDAPKIKNQDLFPVETTPTLYRVRYAPYFHVEMYEQGEEHDFDSILRWLTATATPEAEAAGKRENNDLLQSKEDKVVDEEDKKEDSYDAAVYRDT